MIIREVIQILDDTIYRNYSDKGVLIRNKTTGMLFIDVNSSIDYEYEETDERPNSDQWQQPTSPDTLYQKGDVVTHNGETWESEVDANFWEPSVWGWIQI